MKKNNRPSYKDMKITFHGQFRLAGRKSITTQDERRRVAFAARYKGERLSPAYCKKMGWGLNMHSAKLYMVYEGCVFVFVGKARRTLATVIPVASGVI